MISDLATRQRGKRKRMVYKEQFKEKRDLEVLCFWFMNFFKLLKEDKSTCKKLKAWGWVDVLSV